MFKKDIKISSKNEKELETLIIGIGSQDIGIEFAIEKCAVLIMKRGKREIADGIELSNQKRITVLGGKEIYNDLELLEAETIKQTEIKEKK